MHEKMKSALAACSMMNMEPMKVALVVMAQEIDSLRAELEKLKGEKQ